MLYNIIYKNGSNEIELFKDIKEFGAWWRIMVRLGNRRRNSVISIQPLKNNSVNL